MSTREYNAEEAYIRVVAIKSTGFS